LPVIDSMLFSDGRLNVVEVRLRRRLNLVLGVLSSALVTCCAVAPLGATAGAEVVTPSSVISTAASAIATQASVHVVFVAHAGSPSKTETIVADVGRASGTETATEGKASLVITLSTTHVYVSGNASGLTTIFGMSSADATKVGKDWESWNAGTSEYANLKSDLTMSSVRALLPKAKGTTLTTVDSKGSTFSVLKWTIAATSSVPGVANTLTVSSGATTLPVKEVARISNGARAMTTLSGWGEQIVIGIPPVAATIPSSIITG
jgi:hypothetical protein